MILSIQSITAEMRPSVVSIGNFDGVHRGHQSVINQLLEQSKLLNLSSVVVTFDPLAKEYFASRHEDIVVPARLTSSEQRSQLLLQYGVDHVVCLPFDDALAGQSAADFVKELLIDALQTRYLVVGDDFRFGHQRQGDFTLLQKIGRKHDFSVAAMQTFRLNGNRVSSGYVREALVNNDFVLAKQLLGRTYSIYGRVEKGDQIGQTIGFPTANIHFPGVKLPLQGVFAVQAKLPDGDLYDGVANIGKRPTVNGKENRLEVHLLDLPLATKKDVSKSHNKTRQLKTRQLNQSEASYDLYGLDLEVFFMHKIRDEFKFNNITELQTQIRKDVEHARLFFSENDVCVNDDDSFGK